MALKSFSNIPNNPEKWPLHATNALEILAKEPISSTAAAYKHAPHNKNYA